MHLSGKMDIFATLGVQKCYFEVSSSALSYTRVFNSILSHFFVKHEIISLQ